MGPTRNYRSHMLGTAAFAIMAIIAQPNAWADPDDTKQAIAFEIESIALGDALRQFSAQSGTPILFSEADVAGRMSPALEGNYAPAAALARLLEGTGLETVAGVMNFVLRDDFEGAETALRYGSVTSGDMEEYRFSQTLGTAWTSGNLLATYEYSGRDNLTLEDRPEIAASTKFDGQRERHDLLPEQSRHSAVVAANQAFGPALKVALTGVYSDRSASNTTVATTGQISADDVDSEFVSASLGADYDLSTRWQLSFDTTYSRIRNAASDQTLTPTVRTPTIRRTQSDLWSADLLLSGDLIDGPGGTIAAAAGAHYREESLTSDIAASGNVENDGRRTVGAIFGELGIPLIGPQNAVPGIRRLDLNLSGRLDDYSDFGTTFNPKIGALWSPLKGLNLRSTYSESFAPPALGRVGDRRRTADVYPYAFVAAGVGMQPADPALLGTDYMYVTGTGADLDPETSRTYTFGFDYQLDRGDSAWTVKSTYYDIAFDGRLGTTPLPGSLPAVFAPFIVETDPSSLPDGTVIFFPSQADVDAILGSLTRPVSFLVGSEGLDNIGVINNAAVVRNLASTETSGMDLQIDYETPTAIGALSAGLSANYIFDFTQQASVSTSPANIRDLWERQMDFLEAAGAAP